MGWLSKFYLKEKNISLILSTSTAGLLFRRSQLSWLYLLSYNHLILCLCLAIFCGRLDFFLIFFSLLWVVFVLPFYFICVVLVFVFGVLSYKGFVVSIILYVLPNSMAFLLSKLIIIWCFCIMVFFFFKFLLKFFFFSVEHTIRFITFLGGVFSYLIYLGFKHEPVIYMVYNLLLEISALFYVLIAYIFLNIKNYINFYKIRNWFLLVWWGVCYLIFKFFSPYFNEKLKKRINKNLELKFFNSFYGVNIEVKAIKLKLIKVFSLLLNIEERFLVKLPIKSKNRKDLREKVKRKAKMYSELKKHQKSTVDDIYKNFL